ncbi:MAG TPA: carboxypeptidase-like regulatory domain-containing protein, partial [Chitinophagaceae bacterium]
MEKTFSGNCRRSLPHLRLLLVLFLIQMFALPALAQQRVAGTVRDSKSSPLSGVTIAVKGQTGGVTTDSAGRYSINIPSNETVLVFSFVGYVPKEEKVGSRQMINVSLADKAGDLDEVVVIGYGQT